MSEEINNIESEVMDYIPIVADVVSDDRVGLHDPANYTFYNYRDHNIVISSLTGEATISIEAYFYNQTTHTYVWTTLVQTPVIPDGSNKVYLDLLPILSTARDGFQDTIFDFRIRDVSVSPVVLLFSATWVCGDNKPTNLDFIEPLRYISKRFSPLYPVPSTGEDYELVVDGTGAMPQHPDGPVTDFYNPQSSYQLRVGLSPVVTYNFEKACEEYQFTYVNSVGAVVSYIPQGACVKSKGYERKTYKPSLYFTKEYANTITTTYSFNTEYFDEVQSEMFVSDFLSSPMIVFYAPEYPSGIEIHITDSSANYMTKQNTSGPLYYSFGFEVSETIIHR